ncbi:MAG: AmmeMemoRadiSam system protein A [Defluviitaleaceae bacterium]|nr:AmmeMemoRadiSam system protein A [Defluviitaleaceae bacterium]MCL2264162.1 AmmeMemoRadiSam system protein A [Defluviitaleaceae bacterium]
MILSAYVMPHPPLALPKIGGGMEEKISETVQAMNKAAAEISKQKPDTIIFITPHGNTYSDYFHISSGAEAVGDFSRFGVANAKYRVKYDTDLIAEISRIVKEANFPAGTDGETDPALDHGMMVPMHYINERYMNYKAVRVSISGLDATAHFDFGEILTKAVNAIGRRTVIIASGDLSHKLGGTNGFAPEGELFDRDIMKHLRECDFDTLLKMPHELRHKAAECGYGSFSILAGCLSGAFVSAKQLSYEKPFGVGYGVVRFAIEDSFRALARHSLEHRVKTGEELNFPPPDFQIPQEMLSTAAGAFVSLHKNGKLRGCIGTIVPTTECIAEEIMQNAVSAGLQDPRFPPVEESELPHLTYKVDILDAPEDIKSAKDLDVKRYGVIVQSGFKRGLLLPNLDGVDSVDAQISIACQKAGIAANENFCLQRFNVTRYE